MSAAVVAYSAAPEDERLTLKVECAACGIEWGWASDTAEDNERLEEMAERHNEEHHSPMHPVPEVPR